MPTNLCQIMEGAYLFMNKFLFSFVSALCLLLSGCAVNGTHSLTPTENSSLVNSAVPTITDTSEKGQITLSAADKESLSKQLAEKWLDKWREISVEKEGMVNAEASVFCVQLSDGSILAAIIYPCYKNNCAVFYRLSDSGISEYGEYTCGWQLELLDNGETEFLHINTVYPASTAGTSGENGEVDDEYFMITESRLESVLCVGRQVFDSESVSWFRYDNEHDADEITSDEYEKLKTPYSQDSKVVFSDNLDENGDYQNDVFYSFEDNADELQSVIQSLLNAEVE